MTINGPRVWVVRQARTSHSNCWNLDIDGTDEMANPVGNNSSKNTTSVDYGESVEDLMAP